VLQNQLLGKVDKEINQITETIVQYRRTLTYDEQSCGEMSSLDGNEDLR
jgi:hypothetical protein